LAGQQQGNVSKINRRHPKAFSDNDSKKMMDGLTKESRG
jgi:hypothetical protein